MHASCLAHVFRCLHGDGGRGGDADAGSGDYDDGAASDGYDDQLSYMRPFLAHVFKCLRRDVDGDADADDGTGDCDDAGDDGGDDNAGDGDDCDEDVDRLSYMRLSWRMYLDAPMVMVIVIVTMMTIMMVTMLLMMVMVVMKMMIGCRICVFLGACIWMLQW